MLSGRCYCGHVQLSIAGRPTKSVYCHCHDCRRWTGAPVAAFVQIAPEAVALDPEVEALEATTGVRRQACPQCGSPLVARFDYLPEQAFVPIGILDQAGELAPSLHCHAEARLPWLHIADQGIRVQGSARDTLNMSTDG